MRASVWVLLVVLLIEVLALYLPLTGFEINVSVWFKGDALVYEKIFLFIPVRSRSACTVNDAMARVFAIQGGCGENLANLPGITLSAGQLRNLFIGCNASFGYFRYDFQYDINKMLIPMGTFDSAVRPAAAAGFRIISSSAVACFLCFIEIDL